MKIDNLTGRELDMAVARHVLGYEVEERIDMTTGERDVFLQQVIASGHHHGRNREKKRKLQC